MKLLIAGDRPVLQNQPRRLSVDLDVQIAWLMLLSEERSQVIQNYGVRSFEMFDEIAAESVEFITSTKRFFGLFL